MPDYNTLISAVYAAYQFVHPEADFEDVEAWGAELNAERKPRSEALAAYCEICTDCLVSVLETGDQRDLSTFDLIRIGVAAGYYDRSYEVALEVDEVRQIVEVLCDASSNDNLSDEAIDDCLDAIG